ncbi:hypothetical protein PHMEG_0002121 [Phytophthora megakarya]|uniref:SAP30-binding protein n=1 Tax=Phytophthora megakarya TaxID=4795 RepID=A0A225WZG5_9STRA|nr:hypothetical protein PHMEG_0002121 [Phytophthora megakarya]
MNSLGLEYGSSSEDEDAHSAPPSQTKAVALVASAPAPVEAPVIEVTAISDEVPVQPSEKAVETNVSLEGTGLDESVDGDDEAMLLRAGIPPAAPPLPADNETQQRIERFLRVQSERGQDFQTTLQDKKEVRNPYILEKVVEYFGIDELQSNFPPDVFNPRGLSLHEYADALALEQKKREDARAHRQQNHRQIQFAPATSGHNAD